MSEEIETKLIQLFTEKIEEIREQFEEERKRMRRTTNGFILAFSVAILMFMFSAGIVVQKINNLEKTYYEVGNKVDLLYMVAIKNGDIPIEFNTRGGEQNKK